MPRLVLLSAGLLVGTSGAVYLARRALLRNAASQAMVLGFLLAVAGILLHRLGRWGVGDGGGLLAQVLVADASIIAVVVLTLAVTTDRRLIWPGLVHVVLVALLAAFPGKTIPIFPIGTLLGLVLLALISRSRDRS
jgi:hypothetical protein